MRDRPRLLRVPLVGQQRRRPVDDPHVAIAIVDGDARHLAGHELNAVLLRQRLRPCWIDGEGRRSPGGRGQVATSGENERDRGERRDAKRWGHDSPPLGGESYLGVTSLTC